MSWHCSGIIIERDCESATSIVLEHFGLVDAYSEEVGSFDDATSFEFDGVAVAKEDPVLVVIDSMMFGAASLPDLPTTNGESIWPRHTELFFEECSEGRRMVAFILEGSTGTYGYSAYNDGKCVRRYLHHHGRVVFDEGEEPSHKSNDVYRMETAILRMLSEIYPVLLRLDVLEFRLYRARH